MWINMTDSIEWALFEIEKQNWQINSPVESVQLSPWACVYRFNTTQGFIYLKSVPEKLSIEPNIIQILFEKLNANVPKIIAVNDQNACFLMHDCGITLHNYFKKEFQSEILINILCHYIGIQIKSIDCIPQFLSLGVPDWRIGALTKQYDALISDEKLLLDDGLTGKEIGELKILKSALSNICEKLSRYKIPDTFGHADFHDKNILIDPKTQKTTIIDLGEVVITQPFFSLLNCIHRAKENFNLSDDQYESIKNSILKKWTIFESEKNISEIFSLIEKCWSIHSVLGEYRLIHSVDRESYNKLKREGRISRNLRFWISENKK